MDGQLYVTPTSDGWLAVPEGTTLDDIEWTPSYVPKVKVHTYTVEKIRSSSSTKIYLVTTHPNGMKTCTCPGFTFRRFCKHTGAK